MKGHEPIYRVLLIDDDPLFANFLRKKAAAKRIQLVHEESLIAALYNDYLDSYDAVIVDYLMPELDGFEISVYLATFLKGLPVVLISQSYQASQNFLDDGPMAATFVLKSQGLDAILGATLDLIRTSQHVPAPSHVSSLQVHRRQ